MSIILSPKLRLSRPGVYMHYCPGCKSRHFIYTTPQAPGGPVWTYGNDPFKPTFHPSIHIWYKNPTCTDEEADRIHKKREGGDRSEEVPWVQVTVCHYFLKEGMLEFLNDCQHELKGKTVELPDIPECNYADT